jgi:hypothetical protein
LWPGDHEDLCGTSSFFFFQPMDIIIRKNLIIATFLTNWYITPWQHNTSINRNKLWNSYLVCAIRHCSPACLVHNFRCQWYTVISWPEKCIQYWGQDYSKSSGQKCFLVSYIKFTIFRSMDKIFADKKCSNESQHI